MTEAETEAVTRFLFALAGLLTYLAVLIVFGVSTDGGELIGGALTGAIVGYVVGSIVGRMQAVPATKVRTLRVLATAYIIIALVVHGAYLAIHLHAGVGGLELAAAIARAPLRALFWPIYVSRALFPPVMTFAVFVAMALVVALLLLAAWQRYASRLLGAPDSDQRTRAPGTNG